MEVVGTYRRSCRKDEYLFSEKLISPAAQQLLCACITADMRLHNTCCASGNQLLCINLSRLFLSRIIGQNTFHH